MKPLSIALVVMLTLTLLLCPQPALEGAREGLYLFGRQVAPALLPCMFCLNLLDALGLFFSLKKKLPATAALLSGAFAWCSGAPGGARLLSALYGDSPTAWSLCPGINLLGPAFLLGTVALGQYGQTACFYPMALGHYGAALVYLLLAVPKKASPSFPSRKSMSFPQAFQKSILGAVESLMYAGGCIILCTAIGHILGELLPLSPMWKALLAGLLEAAGGCATMPDSGLSLRWQLTLCAGILSFGGLSVGLQSLCFLSLQPGKYLSYKALMGLFSGLICYLTCPWFVKDTVQGAFAPRRLLVSRSAGLLGLSLSSAAALLFTLTVCLSLKGLSRKESGLQKI